MIRRSYCHHCPAAEVHGGDPVALGNTRDTAWASLDADFAFVARCNLGSEGCLPRLYLA